MFERHVCGKGVAEKVSLPGYVHSITYDVSLGTNRAADLLFGSFAGLQDRKASVHIIMRLRDHVRSNYLANFASSRGPRIDGSAHVLAELAGLLAAPSRRALEERRLRGRVVIPIRPPLAGFAAQIRLG